MDKFRYVEPPRRCTRVELGHGLEPTQIKLSRQNFASNPWVEATLGWFNGEAGLIGLELNSGGALHLLCHDVKRIYDIVNVTGNRRVILRSHGVLAVPDGAGYNFLFSVKPAEGNQLGPCGTTRNPSPSVRVKAEGLPTQDPPGATYHRVLFPDSGPWRIGRIQFAGEAPDEADQHSRDARAQLLCGELWATRARLRDERNSGARVREIHLEQSAAGEVRVGVCLDCDWIEWGLWSAVGFIPGAEYESNHTACLVGPQEPSDRNMRLSVGATGSPWEVWYDRFNPPHVRPGSYALVGMANHAARLASSIWRMREERRGARRHSQVSGTHNGVGFTIRDGTKTVTESGSSVNYSAWAACLDCMWLAGLNDFPYSNWDAEMEAAVSAHQADPEAP